MLHPQKPVDVTLREKNYCISGLFLPKALNPFLISFLRAGLFCFPSLLLVSVEPGGVRRERDSGFCVVWSLEPSPALRWHRAAGGHGGGIRAGMWGLSRVSPRRGR